VTLLQARIEGVPLVTRLENGAHRETIFDYGDTPAVILRAVDGAVLDTYRRTNAAGIPAARTLLGVALRDGVIPPTQAAALGIRPYRSRQKRDNAPVGRRLTAMEVGLLRGAPDLTTAPGRRDRAILDTLLFLGLRREEVGNLSLADFGTDDGRLVLTVKGKGGKRRKLTVHRELQQSLERWLADYGHTWGDPVPLFVRVRRGGHLGQERATSQAIGDLVTAYGDVAGLGHLSAHDLRRTFGRRLSDLGASLAAIQRLYGHSSPETTARYIGLGDDSVQAEIDRLVY
jgi:integrase